MISLRATVFSDIHWHAFNNGLSIEDCASVEAQVYQRAIDNGSNIIMFLGDWYMLRNPPHHVRKIAEEALAERAATASKLYEFRLVGNHDRESKNAHSGHSMMHLEIYGGLYGNYLTVMDRRRKYNYGSLVAIHAVPAGHSIEVEPFEFGSEKINIAVFHDLVQGSWVQSGSFGQASQYGINPKLLDRSEFDLVLGGDNHVRQELSFVNTTGWYCGAAMQHSFGDTGQARGGLDINIFKDGDTKLVHVEPFDTLHPKFVTIEATVAHRSDIDAICDIESTVGNIYKITLKAEGKLLSQLDQSKLESRFRKELKARHVTVILQPQVTFVNIIPELSGNKPCEEDWETYVKSGKLDADGIPSDLLITRGLEFLHGAK